MEPIITVSSLRKTFGTIHAVDGISFSVPQGSLFAFLGPNGAGKSTTIDMICTLTAFDGGSAKIAGYTLGTQDSLIRSSIGAVFQDSLLDNLLTVKENLWIRGSFYGLPREVLRDNIQMAVQATGVGDLLDRPYGKLSGGQRRRCDIARALANAPKVLFLDEPTNGVDPVSRRDFWRILYQLLREKVTIIVSTAYLDEAERCNRLALIHRGKLLATGTPEEVKRLMRGSILEVRCSQPRRAAAVLRQKLAAESVGLFGDRVHVVSADADGTAADVRAILAQGNLPFLGIRPIEPSLEDVFVSVLGQENGGRKS